MDEFLILLQAKLDEAKSKENINKTGIPNLQSQLDKLKVQVELDPKATQTLADNIGKLINQKIVISDMSVNQTQIVKTGQQIGKIISDNAKKAISNVSSKSIGKYFKVDSSTTNQFRNEMEKLVKEWTNTKGKLTDVNIQTRTSYDEKEARNIERLHQATVTYKNELDEVIKKTIAWRQIGTTTNANGEEEILRGFVEVAGRYSKSIDTASAKTDNFAKKQKETVANMQNTINQITSRVFDSNSSRPITSDSSLEKLNIQVAYVENAMYDLKNATSTTFDDAKIKVQDEISQLKILEKELRNADNISNKMKGTDVTSGISIAKNDLEKFKAEAKDFPQITQTIKDLDKAITNVGDASSLNAFNDQLRVARSELAKIKSETSTVNRNEKVGINISGLQSKIADLQRISPEINKFETEINGVKVTVQSLLADLSKINTQSDFSVVNSKWKAFTDAAKSAGIAVTDVGNSLSQSAKESSRLLKELEKSYQSIKNLQIRKSTLDPIADSSKIAKLNEEIAKEKNNYNNAFRSASANGNFDISAWKEIKSAIDSATKSKIEYNNAGKIDYLNGQKNNLSNTLSTLKSSLIENGLYTDELKQKIETLESLLVNISNKGDLSAFKTNLKSIESEIGTLSQINKIQLSIETGGYESKVESLISRTRQWTDSEGQARINTAALSDALTKLTQASEAYANNKSEATQKRLIESSKKLDAEYQKITNDVRKMNAEMAKDSAISSLHNQVNEFMSKNGKAVKYSGEFMRIFNETAQGAKLTREEIAKLNQEFNNAVVQARNAGKLGKTFFQTLREGMSSFSYWTSSTFLAMKAIQSVKSGLGAIKALDTALVDLKKTTTMTNSELEDFYYSSNKVAKQMGVTTEEIINQAAAWSRLGFSSNEAATKMAQLSSKFASISPGMSTDEAQEGLVSIIKAWGLDVDEVEREVMDNINTLGNKFAESNIDLVNGMKRSAAALAATGTTYQDAFALFTGAQEVVQNAEVTGRALRSISMRMHGYSESSEDGLMEVDEELKNITGDLIDLTKTAEHSQGVSIFKEGSSTEFKSLVEYFGEINKIWDEMSQVQQNSFLDKAFGKNQAQAGAAIVQNYEAIAEAIKVMEDAAGSSDREMSIIMDSLDYKLNRLSETSTSVAQNLFKRDDMKTVVDGFTSVMNVIDSLTSKLGLFGSIGLGAGLFAGWKNVGIFKQETVKSWFTGIKTSINNEVIQPFQNAEQVIWKYNQAIQHNSLTQKGWERLLAQSDDGLKAYLTNIKGTTASMTGYTVSLQGNITGFKKVSSAIAQYNALATSGTQKQNEFSTAVTATNGRLGGYLRGLGGVKASLSGYVNSLVSATAKTIALQAATMALNAAVSMGITAAISLAVKGFDKLINSAKRASDAANEAFSESNSKVQQNKEKIKTLDELIQKYKELRENENLDTEGRKQVKNLQNDIADLVGVQAQNLDLINGKLDEEIRKLNEISEKQAKNAYETATANYNNAVRANKNAAGNSSIAFVDGYAYVGDREKEAEKILQDAGFINYYVQGGRKQVGGRGVGNNGFSTIVFDTYDRDGNLLKGAQEKADYLQSMIDVLEQNGQIESQLYDGLVKQRDIYLVDYINDQQNAANSLINAWITYSQSSNNELSKINVDSIESFEQYRQKMIEEAKSDDSIGQILADGTLSEESLEIAINDFMSTATQFSEWYEQWIGNIQSNSITSSTLPSLSDLLNAEDLSDTKKELLELAKSGELTPDTFTSTKQYMSLLEQTGLTAKQACDEIKKLPEFDMDLSDWQTQLQNARSNVSELKGMLDELTSKDSNGLSTSSVDKIISDYPKLLGYLNDTPRLIQEINSLIAEQSDIANDAGSMILEYSSDAYEQVKLSAQDAFNQVTTMQNGQIQSVAQMYSIDLNNYTNLAQAKKAIEFALLGDLNQGWADHFGIVVDSLTGMAKATENMGEYYNNSENQKKVANYNNLIKQLNDARDRFNSNVDYGAAGVGKSKSSSKSEKDLWLEEYKKKLAELQNLLDKGIINEREFFSQSEILLNTYLKDSEEHMTKYAEEISDAEKTLHSDRVNAYQYESDELSRLRDGNYLNMAEYYQSMIGLQDEYYNSEALKLKNLADTMEAQYGRMSHVTLTRPSVDSSEIQSAGYTTDLTSSAVYAQSYGDETKQVVLTPILPDGTVLSPEALTAYAVKLLNGEKIDADIQLSMFEGKDAVKQTVEYINGLEKMQAEYQTLKKTFAESPYGDFTEEQLEALEKLTEEIEKHKSQLSGELGDIKSAYDDLIEIRDTYNEYGKISVDQYQSLCDMGFEYLALLSNESGALSLDEDAFQRLTDAKIQQIQVDMALQATDLIKNIQTEEQAVQYLAASYENLAANALSAAEQMLYAAQANAQIMYGADSMQAQAANTIVKGYENSKLMAGVVDIKMQSGGGYPEEKKKKEEKPEERNWAEKILDNIEKHLEKSNKFIEKISDQTGRLIDKVDRFFAWQKKNSMINRAVKSTDKEIAATEKQVSQLITAVKKVKNVSDLYAKKMDKIGEGLSEEYKNKIKNGALEIEDIEDTDLQETIKNYEKWYEKIEDCKDKMDEYNDSVQECRDSISKLYEQQRDLIRQKLDNILSYYSDMDSYLSSITSKIESIISLNDEMGKRSSITELVEEFASISGQLSSAVKTEITGSVNVTENPFGDSKKVAAAMERDRQELIDSLQHDIDNLSPDQSGTYAKLLKNIAKTESQVDKYIDKGWDVTKSKQFDKLTKKLENYYDMQNELDQNATSNTVANYQKIYAAQQKLQNKIDSGKDLSKSEQKKYDSYEKQLEKLQKSGQDSLDKLYEQLAIADGTAQKQTAADKIKKELSNVQDNLENSATYKNLLSSIEKVENKLAKLDAKGYDNLSKSQKKTYDKLKTQLEAYYAQKESLDESATSANIVEYNKIYLAWKKLQDKLDKGKNLSVNEWKKYDQYTKQLENYSKEKADALSKMNDDLADALNPGDKLEQIEKTYEESAEGLYDSYHKQIDGINDEVKNTQQYQNLLAKAQKLEQKKDTKGLSKSEQAKLDKYNAELEALQKGGTGTNIGDYMKTWESWYKLQQKLDNGKKLSASEAKKYDSYKAKLEAWNNEKQTQVGDLLSQMEDDLEQLKQKFEQNMSDAEADVNEYFSNLYKLAKQIAEYNLSTLKSQLEYLDSCISYYKELVSLYDTFDSDKLTGLLTDLDETHVKDQTQAYEEYLNSLKEKYNTTLSEMNEYQELLGALDTNDFGSSMNVFKKAMEGYKQSGNTAMAEKLQSVLDLLNERAADAGNWGEYADQWASEWENAFTSAKQELIDTAKEIQNVNDGLRQIRLDRITDEIKKLEDAKTVLASIESLIQDDWIFEKDGELSEYGRAKAALLVSQLEDSQKKANEYLNLYNEILHSKDSYASEKAYREELNSAAQSYYDTMNETASLENSIVELMKHSAEEEIDSLKKIIEARKQALQKKKEYYDYDKSLKNSQKEIDSIKAQIAAIENLSGAMDAATKAKLAQLKADLAEKEDSLKETKDDHTYNLQIDALDEFAASLTDTLENSTKSIAEILKEYEDAVNSAKDIYKTSTDSVNDTMSKLISFYSGMGMSVDGTELIQNKSTQTPTEGSGTATPVQGSTRKTDSTIVVNNAETLNEFSKFLRDKLNGTLDVSDKRAFDITAILRDATERGVPLTLKDLGVVSVSDVGLTNVVNDNIPQMKYAVMNTIPEAVKNVQPVINIHYDNMINVEGSVDKSFSKEFTQNSDKLYKDFTNKLAKDLQHNGVNFVRRQTLPTVR